MPRLLRQRKFAPFFMTQFLGAFNDNVYKNALVILIAFQTTSEAESGFVVNLATGLFILPFLLFSPIAGQISDKFEKVQVIRYVKIWEIIIMALGAFGFLWGNIPFLIGILFLMGTHSAFFGPVKYSILPQHLAPNELMTGTSLVEMGTFVSILIGTILGAVLIKWGAPYVAVAVLLIACLGFFSSLFIPLAPPADPDLKINLNPTSELRNLYQISKQSDAIYLSIIGISWFWFLGGMLLSQIPTFVKHTLRADEFVVTLFLAIFMLSIAVGSFVCDKWARSKVEPGLVPIGAVGMSIAIFDLGLVDYDMLRSLSLNISTFFNNQEWLSTYRIMFDLGCTGFFGSFFIVPLYALLQQRSHSTNCSRVNAANNIMGSVFMILSAGFGIALYKMGLETEDIFIVLAVVNLFASYYIFAASTEFMLRFAVWVLENTRDLFNIENPHAPLESNSNLVVAEARGLVGCILVAASCHRPTLILVNEGFFGPRLWHWIIRHVFCFPILTVDNANRSEAQQLMQAALAKGETVCVLQEPGHATLLQV